MYLKPGERINILARIYDTGTFGILNESAFGG
jgi:hypothetical protein